MYLVVVSLLTCARVLWSQVNIGIQGPGHVLAGGSPQPFLNQRPTAPLSRGTISRKQEVFKVTAHFPSLILQQNLGRTYLL